MRAEKKKPTYNIIISESVYKKHFRYFGNDIEFHTIKFDVIVNGQYINTFDNMDDVSMYLKHLAVMIPKSFEVCVSQTQDYVVNNHTDRRPLDINHLPKFLRNEKPKEEEVLIIYSDYPF